MEKKPLNVEVFDEMRPVQDISNFELSAEDLLSTMAMFDLYGVWRVDLGTGELHWSDDVFALHDMEYSDGPVDITKAMNAYHPEDRRTVATLLEEAITQRSGFRIVLRLRMPNGRYKLVKSIGRYRERANGIAEIIGVFSQFALPIRSVATTNPA